MTKGFAKEKEDNADKQCGCDCACCKKRNSQYWIDKKGATTAAREYAKSTLNLSGDKLEEWVSVKFDEKWENFDVLKKGRIEIEQMAPLLKQALGNNAIPLQ